MSEYERLKAQKDEIVKKQKAELVGELLSLIESTANMLRGMTMDPAIPVHAKEAMRLKITELENTVENYVD